LRGKGRRITSLRKPELHRETLSQKTKERERGKKGGREGKREVSFIIISKVTFSLHFPLSASQIQEISFKTSESLHLR
jgi:hypothetical protein